MTLSFYTRDTFKTCPSCSESGRLEYVEVPESTLNYVLNNENVTEHLPETKHYSCRNCDAEFIMVTEFDEAYEVDTFAEEEEE
jgi:hypothetical protein